MQSSVPGRFAPAAFGTRGVGATTGNRFHEETIRRGIHPYGAGRGGPMELQCPNCRSKDLKKVSLAYQEGLQHVSTRTRLRGVVVGSDGPDVVVGRATTKGIQQTELSKELTPPMKWSYPKLFGWSVLMFLSVGWIVFYANTIMRNSSSVSSIPLAVYSLLSAGVFVVLFLIYWNHNHSTYPGQYALWNRSFICERCGAVSQHDLP
jgi:hypothetical protein